MFSITTLLLFLLVLSVLVFVHELGHFLAARRSGMRVDEFGFGFPPKIFGIKRGETLYSINAIPLGGFVRIHGESGQDRDNERSFANKSIPKRLMVLAAGVIMNMLLAMVLLSVGLMIGLPTAIDGDNVPAGATVSERVIRVVSVLQDSPANLAGVEPGDILLSIDQNEVSSTDAARDYIGANGGEGIHLEVLRGEEKVGIDVTSASVAELATPGIGVGLIDTATISYGPFRAVFEGVKASFVMAYDIFATFFDLIKQLVFTRTIDAEISGPVGIAVLTGEAASLGFAYLLQFAAVLSINLAVLNLLPIPALDGGRILFVLIEVIRRKPNNAQVEGIVHGVGMLCLMGLIALVTYHDIVRFGGSILGAFRSFVGI